MTNSLEKIYADIMYLISCNSHEYAHVAATIIVGVVTLLGATLLLLLRLLTVGATALVDQVFCLLPWHWRANTGAAIARALGSTTMRFLSDSVSEFPIAFPLRIRGPTYAKSTVPEILPYKTNSLSLHMLPHLSKAPPSAIN